MWGRICMIPLLDTIRPSWVCNLGMVYMVGLSPIIMSDVWYSVTWVFRSYCNFRERTVSRNCTFKSWWRITYNYRIVWVGFNAWFPYSCNSRRQFCVMWKLIVADCSRESWTEFSFDNSRRLVALDFRYGKIFYHLSGSSPTKNLSHIA